MPTTRKPTPDQTYIAGLSRPRPTPDGFVTWGAAHDFSLRHYGVAPLTSGGPPPAAFVLPSGDVYFRASYTKSASSLHYTVVLLRHTFSVMAHWREARPVTTSTGYFLYVRVVPIGQFDQKRRPAPSHAVPVDDVVKTAKQYLSELLEGKTY